ncbi:hypothetical protein QCA50_004780 [Cerrena zonata]|uniref:NTF2-like protein n=1 Tax=Cerrena zonata TaxID=2478898 RepID=A0AAW0GPF1_9APHY
MATSIKLSADETKNRFGVSIAIENFPSEITAVEAKNVQTVLSYMEIAYSPTDNKGTESVKHLCAPNDTFEAVSTFPKAHSAEGYADEHAKVMSALSDLRIVRFDIVSPKGNFVSLRYTARGSHNGGPHNGIPATGNSAEWTAAGNFVIDEETGKIKHWWKDWDKMRMWKQLGWVKPQDAEFL